MVVKLTAHREITTSAVTQPLGNSYLQITEILTKIDPTFTPLVHKIITEETPTANAGIPKNEATGALRLGRDLHEIVERARALGEYKKIYYQYDDLNSTITWGGITILIIITGICIYITGSVYGGPLKLIFQGLFPGRKNNPNDEQHPNWHGSNKKPAILPRDSKIHQPAIELSTIQKIASDDSRVIIEAQPRKTQINGTEYARII